MLEMPCIVETLERQKYLPFIAKDQTQTPVDSLDLQAQFIRLLSMRRRVLK